MWETGGEISGAVIPFAKMGASMVDTVDAQLQRNECGLPDDPTVLLHQPEWNAGATLV